MADCEKALHVYRGLSWPEKTRRAGYGDSGHKVFLRKLAQGARSFLSINGCELRKRGHDPGQKSFSWRSRSGGGAATKAVPVVPGFPLASFCCVPYLADTYTYDMASILDQRTAIVSRTSVPDKRRKCFFFEPICHVTVTEFPRHRNRSSAYSCHEQV